MSKEQNSPNSLIGASIRRVEDPPLLTGKGCYVDDVKLPGILHVAIHRSTHPHARILSIDIVDAAKMPGVACILTGDDIGDLVLRSPMVTQDMNMPEHPALARGTVHAVGAPIAVVVAESRALAEDAAAAIRVTYDPLPVVTDAEAALKDGAPLAHEELGTNHCYTMTRENGDVDRAVAQADHICELHMKSPRVVAMSMEARGILASPDPIRNELTVWLSTQGPHRARADLANSLGFPENRIRVIAPDVGGGFGSKGCVYREDILVCHVAQKLGRPVKWMATRSEDFLTTCQGRDQSMTSQLALSKDGRMLGLKVRVVANLGAYLHSATAGPPQRMLVMAPGCYQIQDVRVEIVSAFTNTVPTGPYRGAGRPEAVLNIERLADKAARDLQMDPLELRRKNFIQPNQFPYRTGAGVEYDSGDYEKSLAEAIRLSEHDQLIRARDDARARGELVGIGVSTFVEPSGGAGFESGAVRVERTGDITVLTGSSSHGQGHETVFAQVVAERLNVPMDRIVVRHSDTTAVQQGTGTFGSRSAVMGGGALGLATERLIAKAKAIAANLLEASPDDVIHTDDGFAVAGVPERSIDWSLVAAAAYGKGIPAGMDPGLNETAFFDPKREAWGFGAHVALVRIDSATGELTLEKLVLVDDIGVVLNPMIVEAQVHGGLAQGLGEALCEHMLFDEDGQPRTGTLMDYAVPRASTMPTLILGETETPNPFNPLGVKGVGEAGTNGAPPAVANAVMDALSPLGIDHIDMPYTAPKLWRVIREAQKQ